jgi:flagellar hook assembly protein FlgD
MRYGILLALGLSTLLAGATCFPLFDLDPSDDAPTGTTLGVSVIAPAKDHEVPMGAAVTIEWTAANLTDSSAVATVFVRARDSFADTILVGGLRFPESGGSQSTDWDTSDFDGGEYSVHVRVEAGTLSEEAAATGRITINTPPEFRFTEPTEDTELVERDPNDPNDPNAVMLPAEATIRWTAFDPDGDGAAEVRIDPDLDHDSGNETTIFDTELPSSSESDSFDWDGTDTSGARVEAGRYYLFAVVTDEVNDEQTIEGLARLIVPQEPVGAGLVVGRLSNIRLQGPLVDPDSAEPYCFWGWGDLSAYDGPNQPIVADDWIASEARPITRIRWWGSYQGWDAATPPDVLGSFHIGIWTATPAHWKDPSGFAHPNTLIWQCWVDPNDFSEEYVGCTYEPDMTPAPQACFLYTWEVPRSQWFYQDPNESTYYWVSIAARYVSVDPDYPWGWQTRASGDAVRINVLDPNEPAAMDARFEQGEPIQVPDSDAGWGLAFELREADVSDDVEFLTSDGPLGIWFTLEEDDDVFADVRIDTDEDHSNGNEKTIQSRYLVEADEPDGHVAWNGDDSDGNAVDDGIYQVFLSINRGSGSSETMVADQLVFRRAEEEQPLIALLAPDGDVTIVYREGGEVLIRWRDDDPSETAKIRLTIDDDATPAQAIEPDDGPGAEEVIPSADWDDLDPAGDGVEDTFTFYISDERAAGRYWIFAYIDRDQEAPWDCIAVAAGQIVVEDPDETP